MKTLRKMDLEEMARTMRVIPQSELGSYLGAYGDECFWNCVAWLNTHDGSDLAATMYATQYWTDTLGYYGAMNHLSTDGGQMLPYQVTDYASYASQMGIDLYGICYEKRTEGYHAVIFINQTKFNGVTLYTTVYDPTTGLQYDTANNVYHY